MIIHRKIFTFGFLVILFFTSVVKLMPGHFWFIKWHSILKNNVSDDLEFKLTTTVKARNIQKIRVQNLAQNCQTKYLNFKTNYCAKQYLENRSIIHDPKTLLPIDCNNNPTTNSTSTTVTWWHGDWLADQNRNIAICMPPKAGCTNIQRFYQALSKKNVNYLNCSTYESNVDYFRGLDQVNGTSTEIKDLVWYASHPQKIYTMTPYLSKLGNENNEEARFLKKYYNPKIKKMINTRHPFDRLYSG